MLRLLLPTGERLADRDLERLREPDTERDLLRRLRLRERDREYDLGSGDNILVTMIFQVLPRWNFSVGKSPNKNFDFKNRVKFTEIKL